MRSKFYLRVSGYICAKSPFLVRSTLTNLEGSITTTTLGIPTLVVPRVVVPFDYQSRRGPSQNCHVDDFFCCLHSTGGWSLKRVLRLVWRNFQY